MRCIRTLDFSNQQRGRERFKITRKGIGKRKMNMFIRVIKKSSPDVYEAMYELQWWHEEEYDGGPSH